MSSSLNSNSSSGTTSNPFDDNRCMHSSGVERYTTGGWKFSAGEPVDDICEHVVCVDCGRHLSCDPGCKQMFRPPEEIPF